MDKEEKDFREGYYATLDGVLKECVLEEGPKRGIIIVGDANTGVLKIYTMDNNMEQTKSMLAWALNMLIEEERDDNTAVH